MPEANGVVSIKKENGEIRVGIEGKISKQSLEAVSNSHLTIYQKTNNNRQSQLLFKTQISYCKKLNRRVNECCKIQLKNKWLTIVSKKGSAKMWFSIVNIKFL